MSLTPEEWSELFALYSVHVAGLGGPEGFDALPPEALVPLRDRVLRAMEREVKLARL